MISGDVREHSSLNECQTLLGDLKSIVESLLVVNTTNVWSTVGGLSRLVNQLEKVLSHGFIDKEGDFWSFIQHLRQLQPALSPLLDKLDEDATTQGTRQGSIWLKSSLEQLTVSGQLELLLDSGCMHQYYHDHALICQSNYTQALMTCLRAIEQNDPCLLAELDYALFQTQRPITRPASTFPLRSSTDYSQVFPVYVPPHDHGAITLSTAQALGNNPSAPSRTDAKDRLQSTLELGTAQPDQLDALMKSETSSRAESIVHRTSGEHPTPVVTMSEGHEYPGRMIESSETQRQAAGLLEDDTEMIVVSDGKGIPDRTTVEGQEVQRRTEGPPLEGRANLYVVDSPIGEMHWSQSRDYALQEDAIMEDDPKIFTLPDTDSPWGPTNGRLSFGGFDSISHSEESLVPHTESANSSEYVVSPLQASGDKKDWEPGTASQFGSVKMRARRKLSTDGSVSHQQKLIRRRNAHKRWHSEHVTRKDARRIMEEATRDSDTVDGQSFSLPDEKGKWYHGIQSPVVDGYFPQPSEGESLMSFLSSQDFATCPELDRENAHFCISEAIISAVEQIKCKQLAQGSENESDASDQEIQELKQRIRIRRKERRRDRVLIEENQQASSLESISSDILDEIAEPSSESDFSDNDGLEDLELNDTVSSNLVSMREGELSTSLASLYSDADLQKSPPKRDSVSQEQPISLLSAESIALSLLKKFSLKHLPRASELQWMVSEKDAPQALLPLPQSVPISPDDGENADLLLSPSNKSMRLRGNMEWAPPRAQLIFNIHPVPKRKLLIAKQNYRCAGCGMKIERGFLKRLRYCHYLGKYFCQCCHSSSTTVIPSRILRKWDFTKVPISNFSLEFLKKINDDPLFNIRDINANLYKRVKALQNCQELRCQLFSLKDFIRTCRLSERALFSLYDLEPSHLLTETETYSLADFVRLRSGELERTLTKLVQLGVQHVTTCELCQAKGFICEMCKDQDDIIFPFELQKTTQCQDCGSCYHHSCFEQASNCPKCSRIKKRKALLATQASESGESSQSGSRLLSPDENR